METVVRLPESPLRNSLRTPLRIPFPDSPEDVGILFSYLHLDAATVRVDEEPSLPELFKRAQSVKVVAATLRFLQGAFQDDFLPFLESKLSSAAAGGPPFHLDFILADPLSPVFSSLRPIEDCPNSNVFENLRSLCALQEKYADLLYVHVVGKPLYHSTFSFTNCGVRVIAVVEHFEGLPSSCGNARLVSASEVSTYTAEFDILSGISYRPSLQPLEPDLLEALDYLRLSPIMGRMC